MAKTTKRVTKPCNECGEQHEVRQYDLDRGYGKYCSRKCMYANHGKQRKKVHEPNVECYTCSKPLYRKPTKIAASKSGLFFCSWTCKDHEQKIGGALELDHYGASASNCYKSICWNHNEKKCIICDETLIVAVHHINEDHSDNRPDNLAPLCMNHHSYIHSNHKDLIIDKVREWHKNKWPTSEIIVE